jgi:hypothetical protein
LYRIIVNGAGLVQAVATADDYRAGGSIPGGGTAVAQHDATGPQLATTGVAFGHIDDQVQTIVGAKTFSTPIAVGSGGTGVSSVTTTPTASSWAAWDANSNLSADNFHQASTPTASSGALITLDVNSTGTQIITGALGSTIKLPVVTTLAAGTQFTIINNTNTGSATCNVQSSGTNQLVAMEPQTRLDLVLLSNAVNTGTSAWSWRYTPLGASGPKFTTQDFSTTTITATQNGFQRHRYTGSGGAKNMVAITTTSVSDAAMLNIMGTSNSNTIIIDTATTGIYRLNGPIELGDGQIISFQYDASLGGWCEVSRS